MFAKDSAGYRAEEKLWLTSDGKIVLDGDRRAATLLAVKGGIISEKIAKRLKLDKAKVEPLEKETAVLFPNYGGTRTKSTGKAETVSHESIETRETRPEEAPRKR